ncbi:disulfide bond formation protein B [Noviherbaspirillum sedimenti]|uniref:Disulfide bond formation protein B n=1 Tax=Noviherbaspirillum sedimenti TaxID=2320865 RepID=A0A3A3G2X5_9BURK|nr:disulfide bond formation protein B [Noviherbaspirillum sedimenti]RJG02281.1 disulfide bond formation protein B [Noviherbaspirillum sedimenti]
MNQTKLTLLGVAMVAIGLIGAALYLQFSKGMLPCPWCIVQRYIFAGIALICLVAAFLPERLMRAGAGLGFLTSLGGIGAAGWLLWVQANPNVSCGIDPLETSLNKVFTAELLPFLFKADGLCTTEYPALLGLSVAQWSAAWFVILAIVLGWTAFRRQR